MAEISVQSSKTQKGGTGKKNTVSSKSRTDLSQSLDSPVKQILYLQRTIGNRAVTHLFQSGAIQAKLTLGKPNDIYEREADRMSEQVVRMRDESLVNGHWSLTRKEESEQESKETPVFTKTLTGTTPEVPPGIETSINSMKGGGQPLSESTRSYFEPRFGADFSQVRVHRNAESGHISASLGARAFTIGKNIFLGRGENIANRRLMAHEFTHVVQQGAAPGIQHRSTHEIRAPHFQTSEVRMGLASHVLQCWPGDGMLPPGDCNWAKYIVLRGAVETAKAIVDTLRACSAGDNCLTLAIKIAAITAEIVARVALNTTCFRGGDTGHRQQVEDKINMLNRCYRFFNASNCPPELITAMEVVVERAREVAAVAAVAAAIALIAAIVLLLKAIIAAAAAAAATASAAAAAAASAAAVMAVLLLLLKQVSPETSPTTA